MRKTLAGAAFILLSCMGATAQNTDEILAEISNNNLSIKALQEDIAARSDLNLSETALPDPEVEFGYLFGYDNARRHDFGVSQSFDFAAISGARRQTALQENRMLDLELRIARRDILTSARKLVSEIIFRNALIEEYSLRVEHARTIEAAYRRGFESGEFSITDYRKAAVNLAEAEGRVSVLDIERKALLAELAGLNGGMEIAVPALENEPVLLPDSFEEWLAGASENSSALSYVKNATDLSQRQLRLSRSEALPSLSLGYFQEVLPGEAFRGIKLGVSIPLWSSGKKISSARKQLDAARISENDAVVQFRVNAGSLYEKALQFKNTADRYRTLANPDEGIREQKKALDAGQISLLEYMTEIAFYYDTRELYLQAEKDYMLAVADLLALEM